MDYEQILKEQMENVVDPEQTDIISDEAARLTDGLTDSFTLDKILEATLDGKSIFNSQELIDGFKSLVIYEVRAAMVLGVEILIKDLGWNTMTRFGKIIYKLIDCRIYIGL